MPTNDTGPTNDPGSLIRELQEALGASNVLHEPEDLVVYEYDATIERSLPDVVVFPATAEDVAAAVRLAVKYDLPVVPRGSGTGLSGGAVPIKGGILIVMTRMNRILEIDADNRVAVVQPGVINLHLQNALAEYGLLG